MLYPPSIVQPQSFKNNADIVGLDRRCLVGMTEGSVHSCCVVRLLDCFLRGLDAGEKECRQAKSHEERVDLGPLGLLDHETEERHVGALNSVVCRMLVHRNTVG